MIKKILSLLIPCMFYSNVALSATAFYYSSETGTLYKSVGRETIAVALDEAKNKCQKESNNCELVLSAQNPGYGAVATAPKQGITLKASFTTKKNAINQTLQICKQEYTNCRIVYSWYDPIPAPPPPPPQPTQQCYGRYGATAQCGAVFDDSGRHVITGKPMYDHGGTGAYPH
jgi:hypothetical protein